MSLQSNPVPNFASVLQRKQARLAVKIAYLKTAANNLRIRSSPLQFNRSDAIMIRIACAQAGSVCIKIHKNHGTATSETVMRETEQLCNRIVSDTNALLNEAHAYSLFYRSQDVWVVFLFKFDFCFAEAAMQTFWVFMSQPGAKLFNLGAGSCFFIRRTLTASRHEFLFFICPQRVH